MKTRFRFLSAAAWLLVATLGAGATPARAVGEEPAPGVPDYSAYQSLLDDFLVVISEPGRPIETGIDYALVNRKLNRDHRFELIRKQILSVPPSRMSPTVRKAWAINLYNYLVIETVTLRFYRTDIPLGGNARLATRKTVSVQSIRIDGKKFFEAPLIEIEGEKYSLDRFERHFLFGDFDKNAKTPPPSALDPRVHFAVVCASRGCPPLLPRAYLPDSLEQQLDFAVRNALELPTHLVFSEPRQGLIGSSIFSWYSADFGGKRGAFEFVRRYAPPTIVKKIDELKLQWIVGTIPWDWSYNLPVRRIPSGARRL